MALVLAADREAPSGQAKRRGSWLAKKTFRFIKPARISNFPILPVSEAWFAARQLPPTTAYFVQIGKQEDFFTSDIAPEDLVQVYMNESLEAALSASESSLASRAMMTSVYTDIVATVLSVAFASGSNAEVDPESVLHTVVKRISRDVSVPIDRIFSLARSGRSNELRTIIQAQSGLSHAMLSAAKRRTT
jgi:hypothetical protein